MIGNERRTAERTDDLRDVLLQWIRCPACTHALELAATVEENGEVKEGVLTCSCEKKYPIRDFIPRLVDTDGYVESFSFEWTEHRTTQLDSQSDGTRSEDSFRSKVEFPLEDMNGKLILDAGCGMGRYMEIAAKHGGIVVGVDLSYAIDSARRNLGHMPNVHFVQASLLDPLFAPETFDFVYSFGVLHHTPDAAGGFAGIASALKRGGDISVFLYDGYNKIVMMSNRFWRRITTRMPVRLLHYLCFVAVPLYYIYRLPGM